MISWIYFATIRLLLQPGHCIYLYIYLTRLWTDSLVFHTSVIVYLNDHSPWAACRQESMPVNPNKQVLGRVVCRLFVVLWSSRPIYEHRQQGEPVMHQSMWCPMVGRMGRPWGFSHSYNQLLESPPWVREGCQNPPHSPWSTHTFLLCLTKFNVSISQAKKRYVFHQNPPWGRPYNTPTPPPNTHTHRPT